MQHCQPSFHIFHSYWARLSALLLVALVSLTALPAQPTINYTTPYKITTLAGYPATGTADGLGTAASFQNPSSVALDSAGNLFVADRYNFTIRKITVAGAVTTFAGSPSHYGSIDGTGTAARFSSPVALAMDGAGNLYVVDRCAIRKITVAGVVSTFAGSVDDQGSVDGTGTQARFSWPGGITLDPAGNIFVADSQSSTIRKISPAGVVTTFAGTAGSSGSVDATGSAARFKNPIGLAADGAGNIYVADNSDFTIRKITSAGVVTTVAGMSGAIGYVDAVGTAARFYPPNGIAVDSAGNAYVTDSSMIRKINMVSGAVTSFAGLYFQNGFVDGNAFAARFLNPRGLTVDGLGNVYVADTDNHSIRKVTPGPGSVVTTVAGAKGSKGSIDGTGSVARFNLPVGVAVDALANVYISDNSSTIRRITANGDVTTFAGSAGVHGSANGVGSAASFSSPFGLATDGAGNVYVADRSNLTVRKITPYGEVTTLAGTAGSQGSADGIGAAARFEGPDSLAVDAAGNVYVSDFSSTIRKITPAGVVTTLAGTSGVIGSNDGTGSNAQFSFPGGLVVDAAGNVFVADRYNSRIRKITPNGVVTTFAGATGMALHLDGPLSTARFLFPEALALDQAGNFYVTDVDATIRIISVSGEVSTLAGNAESGSNDGIGEAAYFKYNLHGLAVDSTGKIYIADTDNNTIRKGVPIAPVIATQPKSQIATTTYPVTLTVGASGTPAPTYQWLKNGITIAGAMSASYTIDSVVAADAGNYSVVVTNSEKSETSASAALTVSEAPLFSTFAGMPLSDGAADGTGSVARFSGSHDVAMDSSGNIYVADSGNQTIRKITTAGVVTTLAGSSDAAGTSDGVGSAAHFYVPYGLTVDESGNVYVADNGNHVIRKITSAGVVTTIAGLAEESGSSDGTGSAARFNSPADVAVDGAGNVYVADYQNATIRKIDSAGVVTTFAGAAGVQGSMDGTGSAARFYSPVSLALDAAGTLYVADSGNQTIRKITPGGVVSTLAGTADLTGWADGQGIAAQFYYPGGLAVDAAGNVYVGEAPGTIRKISPTGLVTTIGGVTGDLRGTTNGKGSAARFYYPAGVAVNGAGNRLYVADAGNNTIRQGLLLSLPVVTTQPLSQTVRVSYPVTLSMGVTGYQAPVLNILTGNWELPDISTGATLLQWRKNGVNINGANGPTYSITNASSSDAGIYTVVATNLTGSVISSGATLEVAPRSTIAIGADFNSDGKSDILWQNSITGALGSWQMNGTIAPQNDVSVLPGFSYIIPEWTVAATGDFNGDGKTDLIWQNTRTGERAFWLMDDFVLKAGVTLGTYDTAWWIVAAADFNGDAKPDLVWQNIETGERKIWLMNGTDFVSSVALGTYPPAWSIAAAGDFNADGKADLVWQNSITGERALWLMNGTNLTAGVALGVYPQLEIFGTGDFNGDGKTDLVLTNTTTGERIIWLMDGTTMSSSVSLGVVSLDWLITHPVYHFVPPPPAPPVVTVVSATRQVLTPGQSLSLQVTATGTDALSYQWIHNGRPVVGATSSTLVRSSVTAQDDGYYLLDVTDTIGTTRSAPLFVTVAPAYSQVRAWGSLVLSSAGLNLIDAIAISAAPVGYAVPFLADDVGNYGALVLKRDGTVVGLGGEESHPLSTYLTPPDGLNGVVALSLGDRYALALKSDGTVVAWGKDAYNRTVVPAGLSNVVAIATSNIYAFALKSDGTVVQWGTYPAHQINVVAGLTNVVAMSAGRLHMLFLKSDGSVVSRPLGEFVSVAPVPAGVSAISKIAAGDGFSLVLKSDGTVMSWAEPAGTAAALPSGLSGVVALAAGAAHSLALKSDGTVVGWGANARGEATPPSDLPEAFSVAAGNNFSLALSVMDAAAPVFTTTPASQSIATGYKLTLVAAASGAPAPSYQWSKNGIAIVGATSSTYTLASVTVSDAGAYRVVATNLVGSVTSGLATVSVVPRSTAAITADFNGDGKSDLLWQNRLTGQRMITLMNGLTTETNLDFGLSPLEWSIAAVADFNADGNPDFIWQNTLTGERTFWLLKNGTTFLGSVSLGTYSLDLSIVGAGDFNGDGKPDLVWQNTSTGERSIWLMNGTTLGSIVNLGTYPPEWSIAGAGDFNGDGKADLVWQNTVTGERALWLMNGINVTAGVALGVFPQQQISGTGDYNGDGQTDILWTNPATGERGIWEMNGVTIANTISLFVQSLDWTLNRPVFRRVLADFNNDGISDLVWQNTVTGDRAIWIMNGTTARTGLSLGNYPVAQWIAAVGDFNNDGKADLVWQNTTTGARSITLLDGTTILSTVALGTYGTEWSINTTGDFNFDGKPDLVWTNTSTGDRAIWLMDGTAFTAGVSLGNVSTQLQVAGTGDFNGDGKTDILWQNTSTGARTIWLMNGTAHTSTVTLGTYGPEWSIVGTGDYNSDGKPDLLWQNTFTGERTIWLMNGTASISSTVVGTYDTAWSIRN